MSKWMMIVLGISALGTVALCVFARYYEYMPLPRRGGGDYRG
jgi:hypothetical protein